MNEANTTAGAAVVQVVEEWKLRSRNWRGFDLPDYQAKVLSELIDAALVAEREKGMSDLRALTHATINRLAKENEQLRTELAESQAALQWYATAPYPDDGSGRPPEAIQRRAIETLAGGTAALGAAIATAQQPLVDALTSIHGRSGTTLESRAVIEAALAKVGK